MDVYSFIFAAGSALAASAVVQRAEKRIDLIRAGLMLSLFNGILLIVIGLLRNALLKTLLPAFGWGLANGFLGSLAASFAAYLFIAGRSLVMADLEFGATAISFTSALSEVPILPLPLLLGRLSDRFGRRPFVALGYLAASGGLLGLAASTSVWQFWVSSIAMTIALITGAVGTALVADVLPREALAKGLSLFAATTWIAGVLGCAGAGLAVQRLGPASTFVAGALLPLVALALLVATRPAGAEHPSRPSLAASTAS